MNNNIGIYVIENKVDGKKYVGQSKNIDYRKYCHFLELRKKEHHNKHLQRAWNKYGEENFSFYILENCNIEELNEREIYWINKLNSNDKNYGYNMTKGGDGVIGYIYTEEDREKISMNIPAQRPIVQLDMDGNYIATYRNLNYLTSNINTSYSYSSIKACLYKEQKSAYEYIWLYEEDYLNNNYDLTFYKNAKNRGRKVIQMTTEKEFIAEFNSANEAGVILNVSSNAISDACNGKYEIIKDSIFIWKDNPEIREQNLERLKQNKAQKKRTKDNNYAQYDLSNNLLKIWSTKELRDNDYSRKSIWACAVGKQKTYNNYIWKFA